MVLSLWTNQYRVGSLRLRMKKAPPLIQSGPITGLGTVGQPDPVAIPVAIPVCNSYSNECMIK